MATYHNSNNNNYNSDTESMSSDRTAFSGPILVSGTKRKSKKRARFASHHLLARAGDSGQGGNNLSFPSLLIDGPYGATAQDYKKYDVVLLVGLGIGATQMVSGVENIINNIKDEETSNTMMNNNYSPEASLESGMNHQRNNNNNNSSSSSSRGFKTRKAYFYWVTREQGSFDWFKGIMNEVAEMDERSVIELHMSLEECNYYHFFG